MKLDLNCDLGEGEPLTRTRALMRSVTSANVACGGHAGSAESMERCVRLAKEFNVRLGAHPGPWSRADFGRGTVKLTPAEFELLLLHQVGALGCIARHAKVPLHHIKLHGGLYHATEADPALARRYVDVVQRLWPGLKIYVQAGGRVRQAALAAGVPVWEEAFADRTYGDDGRLTPRSHPNALLTRLSVVKRQVQGILRGGIVTVSNTELSLAADTICVHSDTPNAPQIAAAVRALLDQAGSPQMKRLSR